MTEQQSEHLSKAQIENYGNRTSGAGSDVDRRDADQRNDQREDQRVDAHLADCPSCRSRLLDFQRTHFALLADSMRTNVKLAVSKLADPKQPTDPHVNTASTPECPSEDDLRQLAAGLCPDALATTLTHHAATCDHCGPLLRTYTEDFSDDFSPEEQAVLADLQSSSASWQKNTARQMLDAAGVSAVTAAEVRAGTAARGRSDAAAGVPADEAPSFRVDPTRAAMSDRQSPANLGRKPFFWKWILVPATAAICALVAFGIWYSQRDTSEKVEKLLAQAYTEKRNLELRIPYAKHSDYHQLRSGDSPSLLDSPDSLQKAAEQITSILKKNPEDARGLLLSARFDLINWNYKSAITKLEKIEDEQVKLSVEQLMTRALALYERAEIDSSQKHDDFEAADLLEKVLQKDPDNTVALFNRAVVCEKIHAYECASSSWNRLLVLEKDPGWSTEARSHLRQIEEKKNLGR